jgi:hypothetical protein
MRTLYTLAALTALTALAGVMCAPAHAACAFPSSPHQTLDGGTATPEQMLDAQKTVDDYGTAIHAYLQCLDTENEAATAKAGDLSEEQKDGMRLITQQRQLDALSQLDELSARYTEQLRIFMATNKPHKSFLDKALAAWHPHWSWQHK